MQIDGKFLLGVAESIARQRRHSESGAESTHSEGKVVSVPEEKLVRTGVTESRLLQLQSKLREFQKSYSREQAREYILRNRPEDISKGLNYNQQPLFPEYRKGIDIASLTTEVSMNAKKLLHSLKEIQVEMGNLYALDFEGIQKGIQNHKIDPKNLDATLNLRELDPARVARLTT